MGSLVGRVIYGNHAMVGFCLLTPGHVIVMVVIDKISSLSCQKVAYSITSPKIGGNAAKQTSALLRNTSEYIRSYPSSYCTV